MTCPTPDPRRRTVWAAAIAWGLCLAFCTALWFIRIGPDLAVLGETRKRVAQADEQVRRMRRALDRREALPAQLARWQDELHSITSAHLLIPLLNSYAMRAEERLSSVADGAGLRLTEIKELYRIPLPTADAGAELWFDRFGISVSGAGSYDAIAAFIWDVEERFPYVTLTGLTVAAQRATPEVHRVEINLEWPVQGTRPPQPAAPRRRARR